MPLRHYVKLFATSIVDRIVQPTVFLQQAYATVKQKHPGYPPCGMTEVLFCLYLRSRPVSHSMHMLQ
nr:MAG TPA: hypothetical protein [Caudoviricetes sp.]